MARGSRVRTRQNQENVHLSAEDNYLNDTAASGKVTLVMPPTNTLKKSAPTSQEVGALRAIA
jgi:hypothetical protein